MQNYYCFGSVVQEMQFKDFFLFLALGTKLFSGAEQFVQFWYSGHLCEVILILDQLVQEKRTFSSD